MAHPALDQTHPIGLFFFFLVNGAELPLFKLFPLFPEDAQGKRHAALKQRANEMSV